MSKNINRQKTKKQRRREKESLLSAYENAVSNGSLKKSEADKLKKDMTNDYKEAGV